MNCQSTSAERTPGPHRPTHVTWGGGAVACMGGLTGKGCRGAGASRGAEAATGCTAGLNGPCTEGCPPHGSTGGLAHTHTHTHHHTQELWCLHVGGRATHWSTVSPPPPTTPPGAIMRMAALRGHPRPVATETLQNTQTYEYCAMTKRCAL